MDGRDRLRGRRSPIFRQTPGEHNRTPRPANLPPRQADALDGAKAILGLRYHAALLAQQKLFFDRDRLFGRRRCPHRGGSRH